MSVSEPFVAPARSAGALDWTATAREAIGYFKDLLRFDTTNPPGNERPAAQYIAAVLAREGIPFKMVHGEDDPTRANVVARLPGAGAKAPLLLSGHLDVVPAEAGKWLYPPFSATEAGGYIWGRGALDMKNMVAMSLMTMLLLKRQRVALDRDVVFAAVADEEAGSSKGSLFLVDRFPELVGAEYVLTEVGGHTLHVGRGRFYPVQVAEKGICWFEISAEGQPGHGSMPHPDNALARLARAIVALSTTRLPQHNIPVVEEFIRVLATRAPFVQAQLLPLLLRPMLSSALLGALGKPNRNPEQAMGMNAMLRNTASPTIVSGGNKINVIPSEASVKVDGRMLPGQTVDSFLAEIRRVVGDGVRLTVLDQHEGTVFNAKTELFAAIAATLRRHDPEGVAVPYMIPGFTDAFAYQKLGATCYGFSPVQLDETINFSRLYHGHDERIPVSGFTWGLRVLFDLVRDFCGARG
ncbi:MAG TPA: M20/M25/M40 family metallo-hydrolase [Polyangia bacterium]|jgi:acetylornithine deacetylase/succinyl-diaminopimelate desuccinylase-like protein|nr:M20/M25/M40 family metallo-hydrolase [Polyangia bacterium]